jgi:tetratricopeptide (TPR) repeat protein
MMQRLTRVSATSLFACVMLAAASVPPAAAQSAGLDYDMRKVCNGSTGVPELTGEIQIPVCTVLLSEEENSAEDAAAFLTNRGLAYLDLAEFELALSDFNAALTLVRQRPDTLLQRAILLRRQGRFEASLADISRYIALKPEVVDGWTERCRILAAEGRDLAAAEADCNRALALKPGTWYAHRNRGMLRLRQGRLDAALEDFAAAEAGGGAAAAPLVLYARGVVKTMRDQTIEGRADMERATLLAPYLPSVFEAFDLPGGPPFEIAYDPAFKAAMRAAEGQTFDASAAQCIAQVTDDEDFVQRVAVCSTMLRSEKALDLDIVAALVARSAALIDLGRAYEAHMDLDLLVLIKPNFYIAHALRAGARLSLGRLDEGLADANLSIKLDGTFPFAHEVRGGLNAAKGDHSKAIADWDEAIRLNDQVAYYHWMRGISWAELGAYARAIADYDRALQLEPQDAGYLNSRCYARAEQGRDLDKALADCEASLKISDDPNTLDSRAAVKLVAGDNAGAFADYDAAFTREPNLYSSLYGRGLARIRLGQVEAGERDIAAALAGRPDVATVFERLGQTR